MFAQKALRHMTFREKPGCSGMNQVVPTLSRQPSKRPISWAFLRLNRAHGHGLVTAQRAEDQASNSSPQISAKSSPCSHPAVDFGFFGLILATNAMF